MFEAGSIVGVLTSAAPDVHRTYETTNDLTWTHIKHWQLVHASSA